MKWARIHRCIVFKPSVTIPPTVSPISCYLNSSPGGVPHPTDYRVKFTCGSAGQTGTGRNSNVFETQKRGVRATDALISISRSKPDECVPNHYRVKCTSWPVSPGFSNRERISSAITRIRRSNLRSVSRTALTHLDRCFAGGNGFSTRCEPSRSNPLIP